MAVNMFIKRRGFTLIELIIVIVITGVLAAIVVSVYNGTQQRALNTHKISQLSSWHKLFQSYYSMNGKYPAAPSPRSGAVTDDFCLGTDFWMDACWNVYDVLGTTGVVGSGPKPTEPIAY